MTAIGIIGDVTTTTALALASALDHELHPTIVEADPSGGSLAAWLDTPLNPSLTTIVAQRRSFATGSGTSSVWAMLEPNVRIAAHGPRFVPAPVRSIEARRAVDEAAQWLFPALATADDGLALLDLGRLLPADGLPRAAGTVGSLVVCHRQERASAGAAAVRLERLAEAVELLRHLDVPMTVALVGTEPYRGDEVHDYLNASLSGEPTSTLLTLPVDPMAAAVLAGRRGISGRRLARLPLMRAAAALARHVATTTPVSP